MEQNDFRDPKTDRCKLFEEKKGRGLFVNVEDPKMYEYHRAKSCFRGNVYADYCEYCGKECCLYYKPDVNLVPSGQEKIVIMDREEMEIRKQNLLKNG